MKLLFFADFKLGVLKGDAVVDVSDAVKDIPHTGPHNLISGLIERFADYKGRLESAAARGQGKPVSQVRIRPPIPKPYNIVAMAVNYMEDGTRSEPAPINAFHKSPNSVIGDGDTMVLPDAPATIFEGEAEVALVIGKKATGVPAGQAMSYIFGYMNFIDGSARGLPPSGNTFYQMKSRDTFCPMGPYIVTADEIPDPHRLQVKLWVNGTLKQSYNTSDMAHKIPRCIEWVTSIHSLDPGDVIATGTNHRGLSGFQNGDRIEIETEGLRRHGVNHIDTAARYGDSELRIGPWMARHRKDFFLATKTGSRTAREGREDIHRSLERLRVDQVDLIQLHSLGHPDDWDQAMGPGGVLEAAIEARQQGLTPIIRATGHGWP